jgi:hypothetical protein
MISGRSPSGRAGGPTDLSRSASQPSALIPNAVHGHWMTAEGREIAVDYASKGRADLCHGELSDFEVANAVFMADRFDLSLIHWQTAAKERIRWLSVQLAIAIEAATAAETGTGSVHESAGRQASPNTLRPTQTSGEGM